MILTALNPLGHARVQNSGEQEIKPSKPFQNAMAFPSTLYTNSTVQHFSNPSLQDSLHISANSLFTLQKLGANAPLFGSKLHANPGIRFPLTLGLDLATSSDASILNQYISATKQHKNDPSHLTLLLDMPPGYTWEAATDGFLDAFKTIPHPVDMVVTTYTGINGVKTLQSATGKRFMFHRATLKLEEPNGWYSGTTQESKANVRLTRSKIQDLEYLIQSRAGIDRPIDLKKEYKGQEINALTALSIGSKGLIDAIILENDKVLPRTTLDAFFAAHPEDYPSPADKEDFTHEFESLDQVVQWAQKQDEQKGTATKLLPTLKEYSPESLSAKPHQLYKSAGERQPHQPAHIFEALAHFLKDQGINLPANFVQKDGVIDWSKSKDQGPLLIAHAVNHTEPITVSQMMALGDTGELGFARYELTQLAKDPTAKPNMFLRDTIHFPVSFNDLSGEVLYENLLQLMEKKERQRQAGLPTQNIAIIENTPGGSVITTQQIRSLLELHPDCPVDVIVQGMGASGGSMLLGMATGNTFATPNSTILLHQARGGQFLEGFEETENNLAAMDYANDGYMQVVAKRSGRSLDEVTQDFKSEFWINAMEGLMYGSKGIIDAIILGPDTIITREDVQKLLKEKLGSDDAVNTYVNDLFKARRSPTSARKATSSYDQDPLGRPLQLIDELKAKGYTQKMSEVPRFEKSRGIDLAQLKEHPLSTVDFYSCAPYEDGDDF